MNKREDLRGSTLSRFVITRKGVSAVMEMRHGKFIVKEGSTALKDTYSGMTSYVKLKADLVADGALVEEGNLFRFSRDVEFETISASANVILDRNSNGNKEWKHEQSKQTFGDWLRGNVSRKG